MLQVSHLSLVLFQVVPYTLHLKERKHVVTFENTFILYTQHSLMSVISIYKRNLSRISHSAKLIASTFLYCCYVSLLLLLSIPIVIIITLLL